VTNVRVEEIGGSPVPASFIDPVPLLDGGLAGDLLFVTALDPGASHRYRVAAAPPLASVAGPRRHLRNGWLDLCLTEETGIASLTFKGHEVGGLGFLAPFITYRSGARPRHHTPAGYAFGDLSGETWDGVTRARLCTQIEMETPHAPAVSRLSITLTLFDTLPSLLADVTIDYADTARKDLVRTAQQQLRRLLDLRWIEVAPFQLNPSITAPAGRPLRIWKHNYLGITSYYDLDYARINPRNGELDAFNHQVTAGWVAVTNGQVGLLLAESADALASMAFCPMRLRERRGMQHVSLNPFGSYHGRQLDYAHLGGNGVGAAFTAAASGSLRPNGPSYNGRRVTFSLLLAPYPGDEPPAGLQAEALAFFYPAGVIYRATPPGLEGAVVPGDVRARVAADERQRLLTEEAPLAAPHAFLANPADGAAALVWEPVQDVRVSGYEVRWREVGEATWRSERIPPGDRWQVDGLTNGRRYTFRLRALARQRYSEWSDEAEMVPGSARAASLLGMAPAASPWTLVRLVTCSMAHVVGTGVSRLLRP
jgi:hypothetical protein